MGFLSNNRPESDFDHAMRRNSEAVREDRTQRANDERIEQGLAPKHCGTETSRTKYGDDQCRRCGDVF